MNYIIGIDQSTQGTKAVLFDEEGVLVKRVDVKHRQWIDENGWVSHDINEIYQNVILSVEKVVKEAGAPRNSIAAVGISNQRETSAAWNHDGTPLGKAVVWQCSRAKEITDKMQDLAAVVKDKTGLPLSPYFPAAKMAWLIRNTIKESGAKDYLLGTMDSWLVYKLTSGKSFKTDYSNASRTQLLNLHSLQWDVELCEMFGVPLKSLPELADSNSVFGYTDFEGVLQAPVPIHCVLGDSHGALFGQGCHKKGMIKTTYGTGSSIMMNIGEEFRASTCGLATSLAWSMDGSVTYVFEGNINYTGAVVTWLQEDMGLVRSTVELEKAVEHANKKDTTVLIPAFSGLSAPYWNDRAKAMIYGMTRTTGKNEVIKAGLESIAYQIKDVLDAMEKDSQIKIKELRVDGGPTKNKYLMQFQSDIADVTVSIPQWEELSAIGAAYMAGISQGIYQKDTVFAKDKRIYFKAGMKPEERFEKCRNWEAAISLLR